jgi:Flp pilus assembly protein TadD
VLTAQGRFAEAAPILTELLRMDPSHAGAHNNLGIALARMDRREEALAHLAEAVRLKPDFAEAHTNLAAALLAAGRLDEAIGHCTEAVRLKPDHAEAHHYLAEGLAARGRTGEAATHYREALRLRPGWPVVANALAWILATSPEDAVRNGAEAVYLAEEVCALPSNQVPSTLDTLGAAYAEVGRFTEAVDTAHKAMQLAHAAGDLELVKEIEGRWRLYQNKKPYRDE